MSRSFEAEYYQQNYPNYAAQNPDAKLRFYAQTVERFAPAAGPRRLHDLGCAFGRFLGFLDPSWELFGSDPSRFAIASARASLPRGRFEVIDASQPAPFADVQFSAITAFDVLEHVPDLSALAASLDAQLLDDGVFVFVVPVYDGLTGPLVRLLDRDPTHLHKWPRADWLRWARERFEVLHWQGVVRYLMPGRHYLHLPTRRLRGHTPAILVVCRKLRR